MTNLKHQFFTCLIVLAMLGMPNVAYANLSTINSETLSSYTYEFASVEENVNRLELELAEAELLEAECAFFRNCDGLYACLASAALAGIGCGAAAGVVFGFLGAGIGFFSCARVYGAACKAQYKGC